MDWLRDLIAGVGGLVVLFAAAPVIPIVLFGIWAWHRQKSREERARAFFWRYLGSEAGYSWDAADFIMLRIGRSHRWQEFRLEKDPQAVFPRYRDDLLKFIKQQVQLPAEWRLKDSDQTSHPRD
ncbi:hypothetical protein M8C13_06215 [Crossiella sp. SN42]|uniref:hypothetical protein n=1 Tax=Crossiella sp. SN42 TaxID=2944808 RepID=UPI00207C9FC7|nr:hypothetical protein [Crossiella sp. SN42]MCO1575354.1 hypothetical protein [Crossiella sp. SN42]